MEKLLTEKTVLRTGKFKKIILAAIGKSVSSVTYKIIELVFYLVFINIAYIYEL